MDNMFEKEQLNSLVNSCQEEIRQLKKQNDSLKQKLNWIAFGDDPELALRYLRKIGYVDFDEERKVYINKYECIIYSYSHKWNLFLCLMYK